MEVQGTPCDGERVAGRDGSGQAHGHRHRHRQQRRHRHPERAQLVGGSTGCRRRDGDRWAVWRRDAARSTAGSRAGSSGGASSSGRACGVRRGRGDRPSNFERRTERDAARTHPCPVRRGGRPPAPARVRSRHARGQVSALSRERRRREGGKPGDDPPRQQGRQVVKAEGVQRSGDDRIAGPCSRCAASRSNVR